MVASWREFIDQEYRNSEYLRKIFSFLREEERKGKTICPPIPDIFNAFSLTPIEKTRVIILGQDPYHGAGQAHGLAFSVNLGVPVPPSLSNIYQEIKDDTGTPTQNPGGYLVSWAQQGVLLLNTILSVEQGKPLSHAGLGWENFTDAVIREVVRRNSLAIFLLWGNKAQQKMSLIDGGQTVLCAAHPSPFSARNGYFGCKHFTQVNEILTMRGEEPIIW